MAFPLAFSFSACHSSNEGCAFVPLQTTSSSPALKRTAISVFFFSISNVSGAILMGTVTLV